MDQRKATLTLASLFIAGSAFISAPVAQAEPANTAGKVIQSGPAFNTNDMTAAHRTLPFGTKVKVVNKKTGKSVVVRINDRGPYAHGRVIDLSKASAQALGISGVGSVTLAQL